MLLNRSDLGKFGIRKVGLVPSYSFTSGGTTVITVETVRSPNLIIFEIIHSNPGLETTFPFASILVLRSEG